MLIIIGKLLYSILYLIWCIVYDTLKLLIPFRSRAKIIQNEIILITGAGSGLGKSLAKKLAKEGAKLVLWDLNEKANDETRDEIKQAGGIAYSFKCDVSKREEIYAVAKKVISEIGNVTILINNAGIVTGKKFLDSSDELIEKTMQVNSMAIFWTVKCFLPHMLETNHGHIVTVASMAGHVGTAGLCDYCASKFAAVGFDDSLRNELVLLGKDGINTTVVCPYYINTGMFDGVKSKLIPLLETDYVTDKMLEAILTNQQVLMLPRLMYIVALMSRLFPIRVLSYMANELFETNQAMNSFSGRKKND